MVNVSPNSLAIVAVVVVAIAATAVIVDGFAIIPTTGTYTRTTCSSSTELFLGASSSSPSTPSSSSSIHDNVLETLPDRHALLTAPFMQQVQYGMAMTDALHAVSSSSQDTATTPGEQQTEEHSAHERQLQQLLQAQLSHSDGIRGFMVAYLTGGSSASSENDNADAESGKDPQLLIDALQQLLLTPITKNNNNNEQEDEEMAEQQQQQQEQLVSLMLMNVIMPTAMMTMHDNEEAAASSKVTSLRGQRLLQSVVEFTPRIPRNIQAIQQAAADNDDDDGDTDDDSTLVKFWQDFYLKWGYKEQQKKDIVTVMQDIRQ